MFHVSFWKSICDEPEKQDVLQILLSVIGIGMDSSVTPLRHGGLSLVQTTDFFYPLVDDPYMMGKTFWRLQIFLFSTLWAYWPILGLHKTAVSIAQNLEFFKLYHKDGWTDKQPLNFECPHHTVLECAHAADQNVGPMKNEFKFSLSWIL